VLSRTSSRSTRAPASSTYYVHSTTRPTQLSTTCRSRPSRTDDDQSPAPSTYWNSQFHFRFVTHRRSIAERGGCFQRRLFVCQNDRPKFRTIKLRVTKLDSYVHCTKISPEFKRQNERSKVKVTGTKKNKKCGIFFGSGPRGRGYAGGKISACCLVASVNRIRYTQCQSSLHDAN